MGSLTTIGSDGNVSLPSGHSASINTWSATLTRVTSVVTGFGDAGHRRVASAVLDITGSAGGVPEYDASSTSPWGFADTSHAAASMTLSVDDTVGAVCSIEFDAVINSLSLSSTQDGDATVTFNFEIADANQPVFTWEEV